MNNKSNNKQYEGIKQKLLKLQALADRGYWKSHTNLTHPGKVF